MITNTEEVLSKALANIGKPKWENQILLEVPIHLHINRLGFGNGDLACVKPDKKLVYYDSEKVILGLLKNKLVTAAQISAKIAELKDLIND